MVHATILHATRLMNSCLLGTRAPSTFMSKGPGKISKKRVGPPGISTSAQAGQLTSSQAYDIG